MADAPPRTNPPPPGTPPTNPPTLPGWTPTGGGAGYPTEVKTIVPSGNPPTVPGIPTRPPTPLPPSTPQPPSPTVASGVYNIGDGYNNTIAAAATVKLLCITAGDRFYLRGVTAYCAESDVTVNIYILAQAYPSIVLNRSSGGVWSAVRKNGATGATISTYTAPSNNQALVCTWTGTSILYVTAGTVVIQSEVVAGANTVNAIGWCLRGVLY